MSGDGEAEKGDVNAIRRNYDRGAQCRDGGAAGRYEARAHPAAVGLEGSCDRAGEAARAVGANYQYAEVEEMLANARARGEDPFLILLDGIEDPHNLGAIIRTANLAGAHGVVILKNRSASVNSTVARTSAGAVHFTPVARVANLSTLMEQLKKEGMWFVCADMDGTTMYDLNLTGPIGLVIGNEGSGVSRLVREHCDMIASIPMKGDIDSLNASVAAGVLSYEIVRQKVKKL